MAEIVPGTAAGGVGQRRGLPRPLEAAVAGVGLLLTLPILAISAAAVALTSRGPVFFRQTRVGREGKPFFLFKLRTMRPSSSGPQVTVSGDARVTASGRFLRAAKLDELPQLWNVLRGEMSLVGPRPEVPLYVNLEDPLWKTVLRVRPGLTDPVTLALRDEESILAAAPGDPERFYREELQPRKLREYARYLESRTWRTDLKILGKTALALVLPRRFSAGLRRGGRPERIP